MFKKLPLELFFWLIALISLFFLQTSESHFSLCPLNNLGIDFCWGCGIGRSMHHFIKGEWVTSFSYHFAGGPAVIVILYRIYQLIKERIQFKKP